MARTTIRTNRNPDYALNTLILVHYTVEDFDIRVTRDTNPMCPIPRFDVIETH
jgi:hypothetical protein